jgi:hypothetical protein
MKPYTIVAVVLIVAGALGLAYGRFSFTKETHEARIGPIELSVQDRETVTIPDWAGVLSIVAGTGLLLFAVSSKSGRVWKT